MRGALALCAVSGLTALMVSACVGAPEPGDEMGQDEGMDVSPTGRGIGTNSSRETPDGYAKGPVQNAGSATINYHNGPVMLGTVNAYIIWYGNWSGNTGTTIIPSFLSNIGGSSYFNINTTYYQGSTTKKYVANSVSLAGQTTVSGTPYGTNLSDANIQSIVSDAITGGKLPKDTNGVYFVLTGPEVKESSGFCSQYCGWHTNGTISGSDIKYSFVGNPATQCMNGCAAQTSGPNGNPGVDAMVSVIAHELEETVTDPDLNAWYDTQGYENGDKCAWTFGTESTAGNGSKYNVTLGGKQYLIQQNWVVPTKKCAMSY